MPTRRDLANAIRALSMDAVQKAKSGHPGAPMGMADIAEVLWNDYLVHNPENPHWPNRDRFVMSNGHGSMLVYSLLHLSGYNLPMEELKNFRQLHSKTPGHPEYEDTPGVETTTGPLGQGITNAVGMAIAESVLAGQFNKPDHTIIDHYTYAFLGDGCLMEGISHEACSLAGALGLGKLIAFYDDNGISIDGEVHGSDDVPGWFLDDTPKRFEAYGWHVVKNVDGHDSSAIKAAIEEARSETAKPTLICCKTIIGFGAPNKQGKEECHGAPLGDDEIALARKELGWNYGPFEIPDDIRSGWDATEKGKAAEMEWTQKLDIYSTVYPKEASDLLRRLSGELPAHFSADAESYIRQCQEKGETIASRKASQNCLDAYGPMLPELLGGSADLAASNLTIWKGSKGVSSDDASGNYIYYGVREFAMAAIANGIALHGGFINYVATFLVFMDYCRNAVRMAALMKQQSIFVFTHDSIGLGEDGPTHQPVEHLTMLRATPGIDTWRPCDAVETAVCWKAAIEKSNGPSALVFSRQGLPHQERTSEQVANIAKGGYVLNDCDGTPDAIIIATGSEVGLAMGAAEKLRENGKRIRVVSLPCTEIFDAQDSDYKESVLPSAVRARVAVEAGHRDFWYKYVGMDGDILGMSTFGASAPAKDLFNYFGFTEENLVSKVESLLG